VIPYIMKRYVATETRSGNPGDPELMQFAAEAGVSYVLRRDRSIARIMAEEEADGVIVWKQEGPVLDLGGERFFYHPSMGKNRVSQIRKGHSDPMIEAMGLKRGWEVLDCTLGLGADALVVSFVVGDEGRIVGVESSPVTAAIVRWGIKKYSKGPAWLKAAMDRIEIICADHLEVLKQLPARSFDIVYFDPMFRHPIKSSCAISPLRQLADHRPLTEEAIAEALRVSRSRVVLKERVGSTEFERLGFKPVFTGEHRDIAYGIIEAGS